MNYRPPTPAELRALLERWELSQAGLARLLSISDRTVRRWASEDNDMSIPYSSLALTFLREEDLEVEMSSWRTDAEMVCPWCGAARESGPRCEEPADDDGDVCGYVWR